MTIKSESLALSSLSPYNISSREDMSNRCVSSTAADARPPKRASYVNLYKWPESDVDFVKSVAGGGRAHRSSCSKRKWVLGQPSPSDSYSWRQMYLRSYVFTTKKETVTERTRRYLYKWPESDVDFVKSVAGGGRAHRSSCSKRKWVLGQPSPSDSYSWRQMYLRSYVFTTKKETVTERTRRYLKRIKTRVARLPLLMRRMSDDGIQLYDRKMKKKGCGEVMVRKLKSLVGPFFSCTTGPSGSV